MKKNNLTKITLSAFFLALAFVLPFLTGQIPEIGSMLCPLHIPVLICGFVCGAPWGLCVGFTAPLLRSLILGMPPLFPTAVCMAFELATYGFVAGLMHKILHGRNIYVYISLLVSMLTGRLVWGAAMFICLGINGDSFTFSAFITGAFVNAVPGIIVQIVLVPVIVMFIEKTKLRNLFGENYVNK